MNYRLSSIHHTFNEGNGVVDQLVCFGRQMATELQHDVILFDTPPPPFVSSQLLLDSRGTVTLRSVSSMQSYFQLLII